MSEWFTSSKLKQFGVHLGWVVFISVVLALVVYMLDVGITDSQTPWVAALGAIAVSMFIALQQTIDRSKHEKRVEKHQKRVEELLKGILSK